MPDDQNQAQNPTPEENSIPASPQEPMADAPILPIDSESAEMPSDAPEAPQGDFSDESNNSAINKGDAEISQPESEPKSSENPIFPSAESESSEADKPTAQIPVNEPLAEPETSQNEQAKPVSVNSKSSLARQFLITARNVIQFRKRKKLDRVMSLFLKQSKITNDEVEKFLHVSDATATRYLSQLEKEGKIKQSGRTGQGVSYSRQ